MTPDQEKEFNSRIDSIEKEMGRPISKDEFIRLHGKYVEELSASPKEAPYGLQTIDTIAAKFPWIQGYGIQKGLRDIAIDKFSESYPDLSQLANYGMMALSPLATAAKYGTEKALKLGGVEHPESLSLSRLLPKVSAALHEDPNVTDLPALALMSKGAIKPSVGEGALTKGLRRTYNAAVDPIGSIMKFPDWQKEQDFNTAKSKQEKLREEMNKKIEEERPQVLSEEEMRVANALKENNLLPLQQEANRRIENVQKSLREQGVTSGNLASDIVSSQKYGLTDADIQYLAKHPEFMNDPEIQRMSKNISERQQPIMKPSLPEGAMRQTSPRVEFKGTQNPPTEQLTLPLIESDATKLGVLPPDYAGLYSLQHPKAQMLRKIVEQPPLRGIEDVAGTSGPLATTEDGVLFHPDLKVAEGAEAPVLGKSTYTNEGVAIPEYELNPQENFDLSKYPEETHIPEDIYGLRRRADEAANWVYNKQGIKEAGKDPTLGGIASRIRNKYQQSTEKLPPQFRSEHLQSLVDSENARIAEANKFAPPEAQQAPIEFPKTIGEATSLLNKDTVRSFEQQEKLKPAITGERELSLMSQMGGSSDPRALAEELRITRQYPELEEFANRFQKAKQYNKDVESFENKKARLEKEVSSMPFSRSNINLADPRFVEDMLNHLTFWGPEATMKVYGAKAAGRAAGSALNKLSESKVGNFLKESKKIPGPYRSIKPNNEEYYE